MIKILIAACAALAIVGCDGSGDSSSSSNPYEGTGLGSGTTTGGGSSLPTATLTASSVYIQPGTPVKLSWSTTNATSVVINGETSALSGSTTVMPTVTTEYTLTATNAKGGTTQTVTVQVAGMTVVSQSALEGATDVAQTDTITLEFSESLNPATIFYNTGLPGGSDDVKLLITTDPNQQEMGIEVKTADTKMTIKPLVGFIPSTKYVLLVTGGVQSVDNHSLTTDFQLHFSTNPDGQADPTTTVVTVISGNQTGGLTHFLLSYDTQSRGKLATCPNGQTGSLPDSGTAYPKPSPVTLDVTPLIPSGPLLSAPYVAILPNTNFISGRTYFFTAQACNGSSCSDYTCEAGKTMP